jgi:hypothetical protein
MGLACSVLDKRKFKQCEELKHFTFDLECGNVKCKKVTIYCLDCNYPEYKDCCHKPTSIANMRIPRVTKTEGLANYIWNKKGYYESKDESAKIIKQQQESASRALEESRESAERYEREFDKVRCSQCQFRTISSSEPKGKNQRCDDCHSRNLISKRKTQCRECFIDLVPSQQLYCDKHNDPKCSTCGENWVIPGYNICRSCSRLCLKCGKSINSPKYETIVIRGEHCLQCGHIHTQQCRQIYEKIITGVNVYYDTQIGPGLYYNNLVYREEPFRITKEISCDCESPINYEKEICVHKERNLDDYFVK